MAYQIGKRIQHEGDRNAIIMASGGADSIPLLYYIAKIMKPNHTLAIHADYGQRMMEMERMGVHLNVEHLREQGFNVTEKYIDIRWLGELSTSKLVSDKPLPETPADKLQDPDAAAERILWWWDVVRNLQLLTVGLAHAESLDLRSYLETKYRNVYDIYIGIRRETPVPMKDNTPEFVEVMNRISDAATHFGGYRILAPFIHLDKPGGIRIGNLLGVQWLYTFSCYTNIGKYFNMAGRKILMHCGYCSNCKRRARAFIDANVWDPTPYSKPPFEGYIELRDGAFVMREDE